MILPSAIIYFNSRPCERGDVCINQPEVRSIPISIHAPARGATATMQAMYDYGNISIHAPARGATPERQCVYGDVCISIHAPARGATGQKSRRRKKHKHFNSRPCERGDQEAWAEYRYKPISIHAPARGATHAPKAQLVTGRISIHAPARGATAAYRDQEQV